MLFLESSASEAEEIYSYSKVDNLIGKLRYYKVKKDESLIEIARVFGIGYNEIVDANRGIDPFVPPPGTKIKIPTLWILPNRVLNEGIMINLSEMRLYYFFKKGKNRYVRTFPVGIGDEGSKTPEGMFRITEKKENPSWHVPESIRKERPELPPVVPPGPDNPLGTHALRLSGSSILIHGTDKPWGIGRYVSHGCIRLYPEDIVKLFYSVKIGIPVYIVREPIKIGKNGRDIFIEVHRDDKFKNMNYFDKAVRILVSKGYIHKINLDALYKAVKKMDGVPIRISKN